MTPDWRARAVSGEPTAVKRASSRANGTNFGRPKKAGDAGHITTARRMKADGHTARDIAKFLGVSRATLYRYLTER
jgi:DNA invertase Pin-like site-specific DNA recombinase